MLVNLVGLLVSSHAASYPLLPHVGGSLSPPRLAFQTNVGLTRVSLNHVTHHGSSSTAVNSSSAHSRRRRTRPNSASSGPLFLHPSGSFLDGVPSSLFTLQPPPSGTSTEFPSQTASGGTSSSGVGADGTLTAVAPPPTAVEEVTEALEVRLVEEADLPDISALLAEILRSIKSRCGTRLARGDFALTSDALVLAVRDSRSSTGANATPSTRGREQEMVASGGGGDAGEIVAVVELCLRQPEGFLPFQMLFNSPKGWEPYMCNLAVAKKYRRNGYGKQLVLLCENVAKAHWGYERMYLHFDAESAEATGLYSSMGYEEIEQFEPPRWAKKLLGLRNIRYQVKHFNGRKGPVL